MSGKVVLSILIIVCLVFITGCEDSNKIEKPENDKTISKTFIENTKTVKAGLKKQVEELTLTGKVEYDPDKVVNYVPLVNGIVERTFFSIGDKVEKGQDMIHFRSTELSSLYSDYVILESEAKIAGRELERVKSLYEDNMLSEKEYMEAQSKVKQTEASLKKIRMDMEVFDINNESGTFSVKAPMTGYIVNKNITSGSTMSPGSEPLFTIADLSTVWITGNVYAKDLSFVNVGMEATFTTLSYPSEVFSGKINSVSQVFDPDEKTLKARMIMDNSDLKFKPEMSALIKLKNEKEIELISIPTDAVIFDNNLNYVVVKTPDSVFEVRKVEVHGQHNGLTYIISGISENEEIVVKDQLLVYAALTED